MRRGRGPCVIHEIIYLFINGLLTLLERGLGRDHLSLKGSRTLTLDYLQTHTVATPTICFCDFFRWPRSHTKWWFDRNTGTRQVHCRDLESETSTLYPYWWRVDGGRVHRHPSFTDDPHRCKPWETINSHFGNFFYTRHGPMSYRKEEGTSGLGEMFWESRSSKQWNEN